MALLADDLRVDSHQCVFRKGAEGVEGLIGQDIPVGEEQDARSAARFLPIPKPVAPVGQVPAAVEELPGDLERDCCLTRAGCEGQQDAVLSPSECVECPGDCVVLIVARLPLAALVLKGDRREPVPPCLLPGLAFAKGGLPQLVRGWVGVDVAFGPGLHVHPVDAVTIGRKGERGL